MDDHFYAKSGIKNLKKLHELKGDLMDAFTGFDQKVFD